MSIDLGSGHGGLEKGILAIGQNKRNELDKLFIDLIKMDAVIPIH